MSEPDHGIGTALRELADEATPPRLDTGALWRAGRRRRRAAITTSVAGVAAAAALVPLAIFGALAKPAPTTGPASTHRLPPIHFPIQFRQVARIVAGGCPPGSHGLPGISKDECFYFTRSRMTISRFAAVKIAEQMTSSCQGGRTVHVTGPVPIRTEGPGTIVLGFHLQRADVHAYADLTRKLVHQPGPRNQLAIIANGKVMFHPRIMDDISVVPDRPYLMMTASTLSSPQRPGGWIFQLGWLTRVQSQEFLGHLPARACFP
jgi:hypothetical protein